ncbi:MAG: prepilin-type N-terminal cleavage/methylation domain-containing protein [Methylacidiphilales bacterium]|nr:prepilin-type N-terminal cleavage/methylation domain-containing protein [Candidatus Methylacidiphilales bacterium]
MPRFLSFRLQQARQRPNSFTLVELLTVIAIIAILAALTLAASSGVWQRVARSRASGEIQAMSSALDSYKTDNGTYPTADTLTTNQYTTYDGSGGTTNYVYSAQVLYLSLSGKTNYADNPTTGVKSYMQFKTSQLGNYKANAGTTLGSGSTYVQDPWSYAYGYYTGDGVSNFPYNGNGFFDLWSTGGLVLPKATNMNAWVANWH